MPRLAGLEFQVDRGAWHRTRFVESEVSTDFAPGQALFRGRPASSRRPEP